ncbi:11212_t:CDS:2 [Funneliformis caledonium]|uniref:11212_t:CDS:1 n=1 Tax=Funneliformis caledonium TaxID=1117310 RepID=A0A9N9AIK8_9GLOM|nr:11212_t:CDS:2 [Funneliformis caledonium]
MSPPCQPYTRGGRYLDDKDQRAKGLLHLIDILPKLSDPPNYVFLENVLNFEKSKCREKLVTQLCLMNYEITECLLTPLQFGIPNDRLRYYLLAKKRSDLKDLIVPHEFLENAVIHLTWPLPNMLKKNYQQEDYSNIFNIPPLSSYLEELEEEGIKKHLVPEKYILKSFNFRFDIVLPSDHKCSCFTKSYGSHHIYSSGSLLQTKNLEFTNYNFENPSSLLDIELRYFTPEEVANLHAFPIKLQHFKVVTFFENPLNEAIYQETSIPKSYNFSKNNYKGSSFEFPENISTLQKYKLLGNSLNCFVISELLRCILFLS